MQKIGRRALKRFSSQKFNFEIFAKTNAFSITFGPRYIHGQSLKEIDFPTRNAEDRFQRDSNLSFDLIHASLKLQKFASVPDSGD